MESTDPENGLAASRRSTRRREAPRQQTRNSNGPPSSRRRPHSDAVVDPTAENGSQTVRSSSSRTSNDEATNNDPEVIAEDDICPICHLLLHRPVTTRCNHTLCESCMATWADVSVLTQMQIVDVDEAPLPFNVVSGLEARCPMCRTQTSATINHARLSEIRSRYPQTYAEREAEHDEDQTGSARGEIQTLTLSIGNQHRLMNTTGESSNIHEWTFFVRPSRTDIVEEVHIHLHPTFRPSRIIRTRAPYEIRRLGWGYFTIVAYIMLKPGYSWVSEDAEDSPDGAEKGMLGLEWTLDFERFDGRGSMGRLKLKVRNQRDWEDMSDEEEEDERVWERLRRQYERDGRYVPDDEM